MPSVAQIIKEKRPDIPYGRRFLYAKRGLFDKALTICQYSNRTIELGRFDLTKFDFRPDRIFGSNIIDSFRIIIHNTYFLSSQELQRVLLDHRAARCSVRIVEGLELQDIAANGQSDLPC